VLANQQQSPSPATSTSTSTSIEKEGDQIEQVGDEAVGTDHPQKSATPTPPPTTPQTPPPPQRLIALTTDVSTSEGIDKLVASIEEHFGGRLDILVNNVGTNVRKARSEIHTDAIIILRYIHSPSRLRECRSYALSFSFSAHMSTHAHTLSPTLSLLLWLFGTLSLSLSLLS
jgi:NAD(P)-dependent dehydrogenase (short-subunit alcohol dehydrogenase family)